MKEKRDDWYPVKKLGKISDIGIGNDSEVSRVTNPKKGIDVVAKEYTEIYMHPPLTEKVLEHYYDDTERAKKITEANSNPLNQTIKIGDIDFPLDFKIISQGEVKLERPRTVSYDMGSSIETIDAKTLFGQKFIDGYTLYDYLRCEVKEDDVKRLMKTQQIFANDKELCRELYKKLEIFFHYLSTILNVHFSFDAVNVKPFLDKKSGKVTLVITDLAGNLITYYERSPNLKDLREEYTFKE